MREQPLLAWLIAVFAVSLLGTASAAASPQPTEIREYEHDFGMSQDTAERNLEAQKRGVGIVGELKAALGKQYAGVWFDNDTGEFVIPLPPDAQRSAVAAMLADDALQNQYRITPVTFTWGALEASQERIDRALYGQIVEGLVQTSLDPQINAVVIAEAQDADKAAEAQLRKAVAGEGVKAKVEKITGERFSPTPFACTVSTYSCDKPMRGGVSISPSGGGLGAPCTTAFKATGNTNGNRFMLTAGHCGNEVANWTSEEGTFPQYSHYIGFVEQSYFPTGDWAKIKANGTWWDVSPWPSRVAYWGTDLDRSISYEAYSYVGEYVCHSGYGTGASCGYVSEIGKTVNYAQGSVYDLTEFKPICASGGDSGGPVFSGNTALGIFSGGDSELPICQNYGLYAEVTEATNAMGVSVGTRLGSAPTVTTNGASNISAGKVTLNGEVTPNGVETQYYFQYGTTTGYGSVIPIPSGNVGHGTGTVGVSVSLGNLQSSQTYNYRVVASSPAGTSFGSNVQFKTLAPAIPGEDDNFGGGRPVVKSNGTIDVFYRTASGGLGHTVYVNGSWSLAALPGSLASLSLPHPIVQSNGTIDVFYRTPSGGLGHNAYVNGVWGQDVLPGSLASDPHAVVQSNGTIDVFYRTPSGGLGHNAYVNGVWGQDVLPGEL